MAEIREINAARPRIVTKVRHPYGVGALAGVLGAALLTLCGMILQLAAGSELSFEIFLGSIYTGRVDAGTWVMGFLWHLVNGAVFGMVYAAFFRAFARSGAAFGAYLGVAHWLLGGVLFGVFSAMNPFIPGVFPPSGFFAVRYGMGEAAEFFLLHILFGVVVGSAYRASIVPVARTEEGPAEEILSRRTRKAA